jgi:hypothetical protein
MITKLPKYWHIIITEESINHINKHRASGGSAYKNPVSLDGSKYYARAEVCKQPLWVSYPEKSSIELTLVDFRVLVLKELKINIGDRIKLLKI